jgi:integrase
MPYPDVPTFMCKLRAREGTAERALEFAILTVARSSEVFGARWDEFDLVRGVWTIPPTRMKGGREHRVPLSSRAVEIVRAMHETRGGDFVFPGQKPNRPMSPMSLALVLNRLGINGVTVHGFRSAFRDWAAEQTSFPAEVAEMALAHAIMNRVEAAYRRGDLFDKRRTLMEAWAKYAHTSHPLTTT